MRLGRRGWTQQWRSWRQWLPFIEGTRQLSIDLEEQGKAKIATVDGLVSEIESHQVQFALEKQQLEESIVALEKQSVLDLEELAGEFSISKLQLKAQGQREVEAHKLLEAAQQEAGHADAQLSVLHSKLASSVGRQRSLEQQVEELTNELVETHEVVNTESIQSQASTNIKRG